MFMKRLASISTVLVLFLCLLSCSKDSSTPATTLVTTPEADPVEDTSSGGVYKGAFVGSSGVVKITLQKGKVEVVLTLDGVTKTLTTTALAAWKTGQAITGVDFINGDWKATFSVAANGNSPTITIVIPGHTITPALMKEKSTLLIKAYEGTYSGTETGNFNFVIRGTELVGISRSTDGKTVNVFYGTVDGNNISLTNIQASGTINGDAVSGTWLGQTGSGGTWTGKRTL
jgi:hypothetical protein